MATIQTVSSVDARLTAPALSKYPWWRSLLLFLLFLLAIAIYAVLISVAPKADNLITSFLYVWMVSFLPYFIACGLILATKAPVGQTVGEKVCHPVQKSLSVRTHICVGQTVGEKVCHPERSEGSQCQASQILRCAQDDRQDTSSSPLMGSLTSKCVPVGRWQWVELGIIFGGALIFRIMLLPLPPGLSHDSWRYLWDARVILHGYSPYVYAPLDNVLAPLRDTLILGNSRFRNVPTIYPPGAELVYVLSYLLAPSNLFVLKGLFVGFDMVTCAALALLLARRGLDPRRVILYAWCPLPIVEFAIQGHVDVITLTFTVLPVLTATSTMRGSRVLTGVLIGLGTLTKLYPILLLLVLTRRQEGRYSLGGNTDTGDHKGPLPSSHHPRPYGGTWSPYGGNWSLIVACIVTIIAGYVPFLILGHGRVFGFFLTYAAEQGTNAGVTQLVVRWISVHIHLTLTATSLLEHIVDVLLLGVASLVVLILRLRERIGVEAATLFLIGIFLSISSHVFPWYTTALLPWVVMLVGPLWTRKGLSGKGIAIAAVWYFTSTSLLGYFFNATMDWRIYYALVYDVLLAGLALGTIVGVWHFFSSAKN